MRLIKKPEHGTVEFGPVDSTPNYGDTSPWVHCNKQKAPGAGVKYQSEAGYAGKDHSIWNILDRAAKTSSPGIT